MNPLRSTFTVLLLPVAASLAGQPPTPSAGSALTQAPTVEGREPTRGAPEQDRAAATGKPAEDAEREESPGHPGALAWRALSLRDETGAIPPNALMAAKAQMRALHTEGTAGDLDNRNWIEAGPGNIGGRIRAIAIHPTTPTTMWVGSVSGGLWKTTNGGTSWGPVDDEMTNLAITSIVITPGNPSVMYASTGEGFSTNHPIRGAGVFKSTDGGATFTQLAATSGSDFHYVSRLVISSNGAVLLAATHSGLWRSTDGGTSWTRTLSLSHAGGRCFDVAFHPSNASRAVAHVTDYDSGGSTWFSTVVASGDGGATWSTSTGARSTGGAQDRIVLAFHRGYTGSGNGCVYALLWFEDSTSGESRLFRSLDGGATFTQVSSAWVHGSGGNSYGWWCSALWIDPSDRDANPNDDVVIAGGIDLHRSTDGGASFTQITDWRQWPTSAHGDHHAIVEHPSFDGSGNKVVYFGNDGGIWRTADVYAVQETSGWVAMNHSLRITQCYGASRHAGTGILIGGTQDNGTLRSGNHLNDWRQTFGGDGGFCASDPSDGNYHYGEYVYLMIYRSTNSANSANYIYSGIGDAGDRNAANFVAPFILDPNVPTRMLAGGKSLWRSLSIKLPVPSWIPIKSAASTPISAIAVAPSDSSTIWVGHNDGSVWYTTNGTQISPMWTPRDNQTPPLPDRYVTRIVIDRSNSSRVFVTFGGFTTNNIWQTTNAGLNWAPASGLPAAPVRDLEIHPTRSSWLYAATEVGLLVSENGGTSWSSAASPADVSIDEMFVSDNALYLATHGRSIMHQRLYRPIARVKHGLIVQWWEQGCWMFSGLGPGGGLLDDQWSFDGRVWREIQTPVRPPARSSAMTATDATRRVSLLFGGVLATGGLAADLWEWDGVAWHAVPGSPVQPPPRADGAMVHDGGRGCTVLFGGALPGGGVTGDTWELTATVWQPRALPGGPQARRGHALAYDEHRRRVVLFGGTSPFAGDFADTWEYDGLAWTQVQPPTRPPGRSEFGMTYDPVRRRVVVVGGRLANGALLNDVWEWNGIDWKPRALEGPGILTPRHGFPLAYLAHRGSLLLFGGADPSGPQSDTFEFAFPCDSLGAGQAGNLLRMTCDTPPTVGETTCLRFASPVANGYVCLAPSQARLPPLQLALPLFCEPSVLHVNLALAVVLPAPGNPATLCLPIPPDPALGGLGLDVQGIAVQATGCLRLSDGVVLTVQWR